MSERPTHTHQMIIAKRRRYDNTSKNLVMLARAYLEESHGDAAEYQRLHAAEQQGAAVKRAHRHSARWRWGEAPLSRPEDGHLGRTPATMVGRHGPKAVGPALSFRNAEADVRVHTI